MKPSPEYSEEMESMLRDKLVELKDSTMPDLKNTFLKFYGSFSELYNLLKNRGIIKEDPYKEEDIIGSIITPENEPFPESEAEQRFSDRISKYESILTFITKDYVFSLEKLDATEIDRFLNFLSYYKWNSLMTPHHSSVNTTSLGSRIMKTKKSLSDPISQMSLDRSITDLGKYSDYITEALKTIDLFNKERYKHKIRQLLISQLPMDNIMNTQNVSYGVNFIKDNFSKLPQQEPFIADYISEIIEEDYISGGDKLREKIISSLSGETTRVKKTKREEVQITSREILFTIITELTKIPPHLSRSLYKLEGNHTALKKNKQTFLSAFKEWLATNVFHRNPKTIYTVILENNSTGKKKKEDIHFEQFVASLMNANRSLSMLADTNSQAYSQFMDKDEEEIYQFVLKIFNKLKKDYLRLEALDARFKSSMKKAKGIKGELTAIKTMLAMASGQHREYAAKKDVLK